MTLKYHLTVEHDDDKSNKSSTANKPELKDTESASTRNNNLLEYLNPIKGKISHQNKRVTLKGLLNSSKGDNVVTCSSITKASMAKNNGDNKLRYISKYLIQFFPEAKPKNKETAVWISGAMVLTSDNVLPSLKNVKRK